MSAIARAMRMRQRNFRQVLKSKLRMRVGHEATDQARRRAEEDGEALLFHGGNRGFAV